MLGDRGVHVEVGLRNLPRASLRANPEARADCGHGQPICPQGWEGEGDHRGERLRASLPATLFTGLQSNRAGVLEGEGDPAASRGTHSRIAARSDGQGAGGAHGPGCSRVFRPLRLPFDGSAAITSALGVRPLSWRPRGLRRLSCNSKDWSFERWGVKCRLTPLIVQARKRAVSRLRREYRRRL
jgi:hypothetical protein